MAGLPRLDGNPFIICGGKPGARLGDLEAPWRRVRKAALLDDVRLHDLRHSFASVAVAGGLTLPLIGGLLGHRQPQTTARYAHLAADPLKAAAELVGSRIVAAMARGAKVERGNATEEAINLFGAARPTGRTPGCSPRLPRVPSVSCV